MYSIIYVNRMFQLKEPEIDGSFLINIPKGVYMSSIICKTEADFRNNRLLNALKSGYGKTSYGVLADSTCDEFIDTGVCKCKLFIKE